MALKFLEGRKNRKIKAAERLEDIALVESFARVSRNLIDSNPQVSYILLKKMMGLYDEKFDGYFYGLDAKVSASMMAYAEKYC